LSSKLLAAELLVWRVENKHRRRISRCVTTSYYSEEETPSSKFWCPSSSKNTLEKERNFLVTSAVTFRPHNAFVSCAQFSQHNW